MPNSNKERTGRAEQALQAYVEAKGEVFERSSDEVCDLVADLLHLTHLLHLQDDRNRDIEQMLNMAQLHFDAEHENPEEEEQAA